MSWLECLVLKEQFRRRTGADRVLRGPRGAGGRVSVLVSERQADCLWTVPFLEFDFPAKATPCRSRAEQASAEFSSVVFAGSVHPILGPALHVGGL